jgi:hypothetical protein
LFSDKERLAVVAERSPRLNANDLRRVRAVYPNLPGLREEEEEEEEEEKAEESKEKKKWTK